VIPLEVAAAGFLVAVLALAALLAFGWHEHDEPPAGGTA
jgi:hypothetical protein